MNPYPGPDYTFVRRDTPQRRIGPLFQDALERGEVLAAALITMTGHAHEPLLGILTPWDVPDLV